MDAKVKMGNYRKTGLRKKPVSYIKSYRKWPFSPFRSIFTRFHLPQKSALKKQAVFTRKSYQKWLFLRFRSIFTIFTIFTPVKIPG